MNNNWDETLDITEIIDRKSYLQSEAHEFEMEDVNSEDYEDTIFV